MAKNRRIEMRTDEASEQKIIQAAQVLDQSTSAFVLEAASSAADKVLARTRHLSMPVEQFDALINSLDTPDDAPNLAAVARRARRFTRA